MSIANCYNGEMNITDSHFLNLKLKSSLLFSVYTNMTIDNNTVDSISQYPNFVVRLYDIHTFSNLMITNSSYQNMQVQFVYSEISSFVVDKANIYNVSCVRSIIETTSSTGVVLKNMNVTQSISTTMPALITFSTSVVDEISSSTFTEIQYYVIEFIKSQIIKFEGNSLNGINKGLYFTDNSNGTILNSMFTNFVQNVKSGDIYKSNIKSDGSAICKYLIMIL